jgi:hypothetical protein
MNNIAVNQPQKKEDLAQMNQNELSQLSDIELIEEAKNNKPSPLVDAFFIGFLVGIIIYSVVGNTWGFLTLIPLFMIYGLLKKPKRNKALKNELKKRNLS